MFRKLKKMLLAGLMAVTMTAMAAGVSAQDVGGVNWESSKITASGLGVAPPNAVNKAQARMLARRAAMVDAYRQMAEYINGVNVDSQTTVQNMLTVSDTTTTKVSALIKGARITNEYATADGGYAVMMEVDMYGVTNSLANAVMPQQTILEAFPPLAPNVVPTSISQLSMNPEPSGNTYGDMSGMSIPAVAAPVAPEFNTQAAPPPTVQAPVAPDFVSAPAAVANTKASPTPAVSQAPTVQAAPVAVPAQSAVAAGGTTGLIVDCSGMGLRPAMSPVIKNDLGTPIYGHKNLDSRAVISNGMASYTKDINNAARAGSNPLVVRAVSLDGSNPVISAADANRVLLENEVSKFLDRTNVVFVR